MDRSVPAADVRSISGVPHPDTIRDPQRLARVREVVAGLPHSKVLSGLVQLAGRAASADCAQLSVLAEQQVATAVRCADATYSEQVSELEDSLCTVAVLSGDVLVAADARAHPWLHDLPPVVQGAVGAYLGVPLRLADGTIVGALCVYGPQARDWSDRDVGLTCDIADVMALELQRLVEPDPA